SLDVTPAGAPGQTRMWRRSLHETVTKPDDRLDVMACRAQLEPQAADMGVDAARLDLALIAPDPLEQALAGQHPSRPLDEVAEQLELLVGEPDLLSPIAHDVGFELDLPVLVPVALRRLAAPLETAQSHPAARGELLQAERLDHVVVGAH